MNAPEPVPANDAAKAPAPAASPANGRRRAALAIVAGVVVAGVAAVVVPRGAAEPAETPDGGAAPPSTEARAASRPGSHAIKVVDDAEPAAPSAPASRPAAESRPAPSEDPELVAADAAVREGRLEDARAGLVAFLAAPGDLGSRAERRLGAAHARLALVLAALSRAEYGDGDDDGLVEPETSFEEPLR